MFKNGLIFGILFLITLTFSSVNAILRCWRCNSDASNSDYCKDPFDVDRISEQQRFWNLSNCTYPYGSTFQNGPLPNVRPVCKKLVQEIYGKTVVSRSCYWEDIRDTQDKCMYDNYPSYVKTIFCQTCSTDGCNGATGIVPIAAIILIPALIAKCLLL